MLAWIKKLIQMSREGWLRFSHDVEKPGRGREADRGGDVPKYRESEASIQMTENALEWFVTPSQLRQLADYLAYEWSNKPSAHVPGWIFRSKHSLIDLHVHYDQFGEEGFIDTLKKAIEPK